MSNSSRADNSLEERRRLSMGIALATSMSAASHGLLMLGSVGTSAAVLLFVVPGLLLSTVVLSRDSPKIYRMNAWFSAALIIVHSLALFSPALFGSVYPAGRGERGALGQAALATAGMAILLARHAVATYRCARCRAELRQASSDAE